MKFLRNERIYKFWAAQVNRGQPQSPIEAPTQYPCYAYLTVQSYGYEEESANYLYREDIEEMLSDFEP